MKTEKKTKTIETLLKESFRGVLKENYIQVTDLVQFLLIV